MSPDPVPVPPDYDSTYTPAFDVVFAKAMADEKAHAVFTKTMLVVDGPCPRCSHPIDPEIRLTGFGGLETRSVVVVACNCKFTHAGAPTPPGTSCGAPFTVPQPKEAQPDA